MGRRIVAGVLAVGMAGLGNPAGAWAQDPTGIQLDPYQETAGVPLADALQPSPAEVPVAQADLVEQALENQLGTLDALQDVSGQATLSAVSAVNLSPPSDSATQTDTVALSPTSGEEDLAYLDAFLAELDDLLEGVGDEPTVTPDMNPPVDFALSIIPPRDDRLPPPPPGVIDIPMALLVLYAVELERLVQDLQGPKPPTAEEARRRYSRIGNGIRTNLQRIQTEARNILITSRDPDQRRAAQQRLARAREILKPLQDDPKTKEKGLFKKALELIEKLSKNE